MTIELELQKLLKNLKKEKVLIAVAGFILIAFLILLSWDNFFVSRTRMDSDLASEMILEKSLSETNHMFHSGWYYSTELRILNTLLVRSPLFKIFSDWTTVGWKCAVAWSYALLVSCSVEISESRSKIQFIDRCNAAVPF